MNRKDAGFTLVEATVTATIAAIMLAIGMPALVSVVDRNRGTTTMLSLRADLELARSSAILHRRQVVICPRDADNMCRDDSDWSAGWMVFSDPDGNRRPDSATDLLRVTDPTTRNRSLLRMSSTRKFLRYRPDGLSPGTNLSIRVCTRGQLAGNVVVSNAGRVRTERPRRDTDCPFD